MKRLTDNLGKILVAAIFAFSLSFCQAAWANEEIQEGQNVADGAFSGAGATNLVEVHNAIIAQQTTTHTTDPAIQEQLNTVTEYDIEAPEGVTKNDPPVQVGPTVIIQNGSPTGSPATTTNLDGTITYDVSDDLDNLLNGPTGFAGSTELDVEAAAAASDVNGDLNVTDDDVANAQLETPAQGPPQLITLVTGEQYLIYPDGGVERYQSDPN